MTRPLLETLSIINLITHYRDELMQIRAGTLATILLPTGVRDNLGRAGILVKGKGVTCHTHAVPWEVENLLDRLKK